MSKLFFLGAGKMATAIAGGIVKAEVFQKAELAAFDVSPKAADEFEQKTGVRCYWGGADSLLFRGKDGAEECGGALRKIVEQADAVLLAVKPQVLASALEPLAGCLAGKPVISIVAGVPIDRLAGLTGSGRIVRVMPNTPALVGEGAAGYSLAPEAQAADGELANRILSAVGVAMQVDEKYLTAVTALSGSGPAYVFEFIRALSDGGVAEGLPRDVATKLAIQTVLGSAAMAKETGIHPAILKDQVTSPGGTTIRALEVLEDRAFAGAVIAAVRACARRSEELGKN
mgnify:CR=1 FL=1